MPPAVQGAPNAGARALAEYLERSNQSQQALSIRLGISAAMVSLLIAGKKPPGLKLAVRIELMTGVPTGAWARE